MKAASIEVASLGPVLLRRKRSILLAAGATAVLAVVAVKVLAPRYTSEGALVVATQQPNIPELNLETTTTSATTDAAQTLADILRSRGAVETVVSQLKLDQVADLQPVSKLPSIGTILAPTGIPDALGAAQDWVRHLISGDTPKSDVDYEKHLSIINYLTSHVKVDVKDRSNLLSVTFIAGGAGVAADVVNAMMRVYIDSDVAARRAQLAEVSESLTKRADELHSEIADDDAKIDAFLQTHDVGQTQGGGTTAATQLTGLQTQLAAAQSDLTRLEATRDTARANGGRGSASSQEALASPLVQALRQREADLMQRMNGLAANYPDRVRMEDELRSVRGQISAETDKFGSNLSRQTDIARANVQKLQQAVDSARTDVRQASAAEIYLGQLTRDADAKRELYNAFVTRADATRLTNTQFPAARIQFPATQPQLPDKINPIMPLVLGFLAGGFLACTVTIVRDLLRARISSARDVVIATGLPVFGSLPEIRRRTPDGLQIRAPAQVQSLIDETLRALWLAMRSMSGEATATTVVITSSESGEGKTTVAAALARRVAADGFRAMLIDADLRRPSLLPALSVRSTGRLEGVLTGAVTLEDAVMVDPASGLHCLLAGGGTATPNKLLASDEFSRLMTQLRRSYDLVVLDSPPVLRVADALILAQQTDHTLLVIECGRMRADMVAEAVRRFPKDCRDKMIALLTRVPQSLLDRRDYYTGYGPSPQPSVRGLLEPEVMDRGDEASRRSKGARASATPA